MSDMNDRLLNNSLCKGSCSGSYQWAYISIVYLFFSPPVPFHSNVCWWQIEFRERVRTIGVLFDVSVARPLDVNMLPQKTRLQQHIVWPNMPSDRSVHHLSKSADSPAISLYQRSPPSRPSKIPLSAFILQDIDELVQAHATYRFVLLDEEEEKPRILVRISLPYLNCCSSTFGRYGCSNLTFKFHMLHLIINSYPGVHQYRLQK
jgi:hypothetical protein